MIGVILNHRYRIAALIGTGGMAQVYREIRRMQRATGEAQKCGH